RGCTGLTEPDGSDDRVGRARPRPPAWPTLRPTLEATFSKRLRTELTSFDTKFSPYISQLQPCCEWFPPVPPHIQRHRRVLRIRAGFEQSRRRWGCRWR